MNTELTTLRNLSSADLTSLGVGELAYVKQVSQNDERAFAIHAADDTPLAVVTDRDEAFVVVRQNDLEPMSVH